MARSATSNNFLGSCRSTIELHPRWGRILAWCQRGTAGVGMTVGAVLG
jgi:hypothetical protein